MRFGRRMGAAGQTRGRGGREQVDGGRGKEQSGGQETSSERQGQGSSSCCCCRCAAWLFPSVFLARQQNGKREGGSNGDSFSAFFEGEWSEQRWKEESDHQETATRAAHARQRALHRNETCERTESTAQRLTRGDEGRRVQDGARGGRGRGV